MNKEDMQQVSFEELLSELSGSTDFGNDELIEMIAYQDDNNKDFCIYHRHKAFCVPLHKIREYFTRHTKPVPPMTKDQELVYLREKVKKLQDEAEESQAADKVSRPAPDEPEAPEKLEIALSDDLGPATMSADPTEPPTVKPGPPKRDESIPPPHERKKETVKEVRTRLAKELREAGTKSPKQKLGDKAEPKDILRAPKEE